MRARSQGGARGAVMGGALLVVMAAIAATSGHGTDVAVLVLTIAYGVAIGGLLLGSLRLYRSRSPGAQRMMVAALAVAAVLSAVTLVVDGAPAVGFVVEMLLWLLVIDAVILVVSWLQRRQGRRQPS